MGSIQRNFSPSLLYAGIFVWAMGLLFYLSNYPFIEPLADLPLAAFLGNSALKSAVLGSFPSLSHSLATSLLFSSIVGLSTKMRIAFIVATLAILLTLELSMGTYDIVDIVALLLGSLIGSIALIGKSQRSRQYKSIGVAPALLITAFSTAFAVGSYVEQPDCARFEGSVCVEEKRFGTPVYMSYADLRSAVQLEAPHELTEISRLYLYKNLIFMNERNQGVHIIDNRFPANPEAIGFIRIPGNLDINIRDDYLYADSYIDLVTIDLRDISNISEITREVDIFPYNSFQNIPYDIDFEFGVVDSTKGVVVGYE